MQNNTQTTKSNAIKHAQAHGTDLFVIGTMEKMSELTNVLAKFLRGSEQFSKSELVDKIAYVLILMETVKKSFGITDSDIEDEQIRILGPGYCEEESNPTPEKGSAFDVIDMAAERKDVSRVIINGDHRTFIAHFKNGKALEFSIDGIENSEI
jgi:hypothetical protein